MSYPLWSRRIDGKRTSLAELGPRHPRWRRAGALAIALAGWLALVATPVHAQQCTNDLQGADDEPGQKDLDQFCIVGSCGGSKTAITWNFDDTVWSGSNTGDGCALFDDNGDGNADRAVCVTIEGAATMQANNPKCYTCGNTRPDRCTNSVLGTCTTTCSVVLAADPFALNPAHLGNDCKDDSSCPNGSACCRSKDAQVDCCLAPADAGPGGVMIDGCSYPSQQPNSDPSDCTINRQCSKSNPNDPVCDDLNPCTVDSCDTTFGVCRHVAGNSGALCRAAAGACDVAEYCTGTSIFCPTDQFAQGGTLCRNKSDACDVAESCSGTSADCPPDGVAPQGTVCRPSSGNQCDVAEVCDGTSKACPPDGSQPDNTPCDDSNACTSGDKCVSGNCAGTSISCDDSNLCTTDSCDAATGCKHVNNNNPCDDHNACTTGDHCSGGSCTGGPPPNCDDSNVCTTD